MIKGIHHTAISTGDFERALAFYRDLLGFEMVSELNWPAGVELADTITGLEGSAARPVMLRASNSSIELFEFFYTLRKNNWEGVWQLDQFPFREDAVAVANGAIDFLKQVERALQLAERNIVRCDTIINELLDYTRDRMLRRSPCLLRVTIQYR